MSEKRHLRRRYGWIRWFIVSFLVSFVIVSAGFCQGDKVLFREEFAGLDNWRPLYFPGASRHTAYSIEAKGNEHYLRAESNASASAIVYKSEFNVFDFPYVKWRWKVDNVYRKGDPEKKSGDDYPIRLQIAFKYDPKTAGYAQQIKYAVAKRIFGEYPPHSTLNYVWANQTNQKVIITSPFSDSIKLIALQKGNNNAGIWYDEEINIIRDYREAFGVDPPPEAGIVVMNDSDDTGEKSISYVRFIQVFRSAR